MSGHVSTPIAWREIAQLSRDCLGIQVGDLFVYVDQSLADKIGRLPERVVGSEPEALLERAQSPATGRDGDAATPAESSLPRETVADAIAAARTEGFWTGHLRAATGAGSAGPGPGDSRERRPVGFEVTITATGNGELVWHSPAVEGTPEAVDHESDRDRSGSGDEVLADGDPVAAADSPSLELETLDVIGVAAAVLDEKRRVRGWNDQFADVTGYPPRDARWLAGRGAVHGNDAGDTGTVDVDPGRR